VRRGDRLRLDWGPMDARLLLLAVGLLLGVAAAPAAQAETVRLRSGKRLEAASVVFRDGKIEATLVRDGGIARVLLRFDQLAEDDLLPLWDRTHAADDAALALAGAEFALGLGRRAEAVRRYEAAARLDTSFAAKRDAGLGRVRRLEAEDAMRDLEDRVRRGADPRGAVVLSEALLEGPHAAALDPKQTRRIRILGSLALRLAQREVVRATKADSVGASASASAGTPAAAVAPPAAPAQEPVVPAMGDAALAVIRDRVGAFAVRAADAREAAADPKVGPRRALELLRGAADAYQLARRLVREAPGALAAELGELGDDLRLALVATYLDLADLHRQEGQFEQARAHVRAALILDPGNEEAWSQRRLIEDDLAREPTPYDDAYRPAVEFYYASPSPFYGYYGWPRRTLYSHHYGHHYGGLHGYGHIGRGGFHVGFGHGHASHGGHHHGGSRVVGRRR